MKKIYTKSSTVYVVKSRKIVIFLSIQVLQKICNQYWHRENILMNRNYLKLLSDRLIIPRE